MKNTPWWSLYLLLVGCCGLWADEREVPARTEGKDREGIEFFQERVRPILVAHCFECHSTDAKQKGGLLLDSRAAILRGGDTGPALVPGEPDKSLLIQAVRHQGDFAMPPEKKLAADELAVLERWVRSGAPAPDSPSPVSAKFEVAKRHWAFQPLLPTPIPAVQDVEWPRTEVDRFILAKLEAEKLEPAPAANRATLLRRIKFDLLGLPPTPEEVTEFVADQRPDAYERLVDRLLANPHYGERWSRHWLDLARYADSSGFHNDLDRPHAWKYRDYVIRSFNADKPYAQFVAEQLAGDEVEGANDETLIATGFCRNGPSNDDNMGKTEATIKQYRADQLDDVIATASTVFLGTTIGCARCHDHKTEAFTSRDYYSLLAIFNGTEKYGLVPGTENAKGGKVKLDPKITIQGLIESSANVPRTFIMRRGIATQLGDEVFPAAPVALTRQSLEFPAPSPEFKTSQRRHTFAQWITSPENGLAWRVVANRVWQHHFGKGLAATPSNLGISGSQPTHPELLNHLAYRMAIDDAGQWKSLHRRILTSSTYQQSSRTTARNLERDPANEWWGRANLRRLEAEAVRDSILAASGNLNSTFGGPGIKPRLRPDLIPASQRNKWPLVEHEDHRHWRRSVYIYSKRQLLMPILELFDAPSTTDTCAARTESIVPTQALVLMNDEFVEDQAGQLARRAMHETDGTLTPTIQRMFLLTLAHDSTEQNLRQAEAFVRLRATSSDLESALTDLAHVLFNHSEFVFVP